MTRHPVLFTALVFLAGLLAAVPLYILGTASGLDEDAAGALARIVVGLALLARFRRGIAWRQSLRGLRWACPALGVALYNVALNASAGMPLRGAAELPYVLLLGLAPAVFEEAIFRGVAIAKLRAANNADARTLWLSALLFGAAHLTNVAGMSPPDVLLQTGYAVVIGLFLGAVYLKSGDIVSVILAHACVDVSYQIFAAHSGTASLLFLTAFCLILLGLTCYALWLAGIVPFSGAEKISS
ncbi:MAG: CPBP family intramembrane metalloprotease [Oscillibacter sp.]|nr:CPBP family intramembrane metalloprotease [Oscillibacter sp.]